ACKLQQHEARGSCHHPSLTVCHSSGLPRPRPPPAVPATLHSPRSAHLLRPPLSVSVPTGMLLGSALFNDFL
ncbi:hypothetical protein KUCAC02_004297, partial [Chaenocephalus aceratus]